MFSVARTLAVVVVFGFLTGCTSRSDDAPAPAAWPAVGDVLEGGSTGSWPLVGSSLTATPEGWVADCGADLCAWPAGAPDDERAELRGVAGPSISADGSTTLVVSRHRVAAVDVASGEVRAVFEGHEPASGPARTRAALSPDGELAVSVGADRQAYVWRTADGEVVRHLDLPEGDLGLPVFSPDSSLLAVELTEGAGADAVNRRWIVDAASGERVADVEGLARVAGWSPDGRWLVGTASDGDLALWATDDWTRRHTSGVRSNGPAAVSPDGTAVAFVGLAQPDVVRLWDVDSGEVRVLAGKHPDRVTGLAWSADGAAVASASSEATGEPGPTPERPRDVVLVRDPSRGGGPAVALRLP